MQELQRTEKWYIDRLGKATGSRYHDVCSFTRSGEAAARKNYRYELIAERITCNKTESFTTAAMQWGIDNEPLARLAYELKTGYNVEESGFIEHSEYPDTGVSPDGLIGTDGGVEIKCPNTAQHIEVLTTNRVPKMYQEQVDGALWVTGRKWWDFISFDPRMPDDLQLVIIRVERDEERIKGLEQNVIDFLHELDLETLRILELRDKL